LKKLLSLIVFSVLLLVPVGAQNAFAGVFICNEAVPPEVEVTLFVGQTSAPIQKSIDCSFEIISVSLDDFDCSQGGIDVSFANEVINAGNWQGDEMITNSGVEVGFPQMCSLTIALFGTGGEGQEVTQEISVIPTAQPVGGEFIGIETTSVLAAGAQYTAAWMIPILVSAIGIGIVIARKY